MKLLMLFSAPYPLWPAPPHKSYCLPLKSSPHDLVFHPKDTQLSGSCSKITKICPEGNFLWQHGQLPIPRPCHNIQCPFLIPTCGLLFTPPPSGHCKKAHAGPFFPWLHPVLWRPAPRPALLWVLSRRWCSQKDLEDLQMSFSFVQWRTTMAIFGSLIEFDQSWVSLTTWGQWSEVQAQHYDIMRRTSSSNPLTQIITQFGSIFRQTTSFS